MQMHVLLIFQLLSKFKNHSYYPFQLMFPSLQRHTAFAKINSKHHRVKCLLMHTIIQFLP